MLSSVSDRQVFSVKHHVDLAERYWIKTPRTDRFGGQRAVRWTGRERLFAQGEVFKHELTEFLFGTGQNRSFKWGVRLTRVFVRRGSTV